jgi:hypothetical protein
MDGGFGITEGHAYVDLWGYWTSNDEAICVFPDFEAAPEIMFQILTEGGGAELMARSRAGQVLPKTRRLSKIWLSGLWTPVGT